VANKRYPSLFLITIIYFALAFVHIGLALAALICMGIPLILATLIRRKVWCSYYCPRSFWFDLLGKFSRKRNAPKWLVSLGMRKIVLIYFTINLFFITMSSIMVGIGRIDPMDIIRFFIVIPTTWQLPQLLDSSNLPPVLLHLSYRLYSVMLSSTIAGTLMALLYRPRSWCAICPINTLTGSMLKSMKKSSK
jgi:hypothetical protein